MATEMTVTYDAQAGLFRAFDSFVHKDKLKVNGWRFRAAVGAMKAHWYAFDVDAVIPFAAYADAIARAAAGFSEPASHANGFRPTEEQIAVNAAAARLRDGLTTAVKVIAAAGAGKSSTLRFIAGEHGAYAGLPVYYLVFGKANAAEAKEKMPATVTSSTIHAAAYKALNLGSMADKASKGQPLYRFAHRLLSETKGWKWVPESKTDGRKPIHQASMIAKVVTRYCSSAEQELGSVHVDFVLDGTFGAEISRTKRSIKLTLDQIEKKVAKLEKARAALAAKLLKGAEIVWAHALLEVNSFHDVYLKAFELNTDKVQRFFAPFRALFVDEAQDVNPVQISIIRKSGLPVIAVGDAYQQIFAFRGSVNSLNALDGETVYLSQSFRFGDTVAASARNVLRWHPDGAPRKPVQGTPGIASEVRVMQRSSDYPAFEPGKPFAVLSRTNAGVTLEALKLVRQGHRVHIVGGLADIQADLMFGTALYEGRKDEIPQTHFLSQYTSWEHFIEAVSGDDEYDALIRAIKAGALKDLLLLKAHHDTSPGQDTVAILSTTHKAKGGEWNTVVISDDFPTISELSERYAAAMEAMQHGGPHLDVRQAIESFNVLYVALTRAKLLLMLPVKHAALAPTILRQAA